ncbi:predicted protein [Naegleria gruberi]|uniref:Predicted protein n=1 Tax=Naegleria gruberi TaxID=5762 RepID=D2VN31_NAEGR|nr:uncharacterized protein NAEGRDRAFT_70353 [Naegleria gruberi]EFC41849.1 predicted protein [Naegleria gruberi]|eukprot:XP_002674593.1 predicted protein [Naegleria gruberi strain NEG-M]
MIKVVFSFDEAQTLLEYKTDSCCLINELCKEIRRYNNPVFLGTTFSISKAVLNVSQEGRQFLFPVIGTLEPWYLNDVDKILSHMFNIEDFKKDNEEEYWILCYLLSGAPENVVRFHQTLYQHAELYHNDSLALFRKSLEEVVQFKEERSAVRIVSFLNDTSIMDREDHLLKLIFDREVENQKLMNSDLVMNSFKRAFIEKTIAFVVRKDTNSLFEIVDPIIAKSYFTILVEDYTEMMVSFMTANFTKRGEDFELFMVILLILESNRLKDQPMVVSPLFASATSLCKYQLITRTFLNDKHLSKKLLSQFANISSIWYCQLACHFFMDTYVKSDNNMGPLVL